MQILLTQSDPQAAQRARAVLESAGHDVSTCADETGGPFPCRGVAGGRCPVDDENAVVAVSAPGGVPPEPQAGEVGLICALRRHLPVLVVNPDEASWPRSRSGVVAIDDLPLAVERAASAELPRHTAAVLVEARRVAGEAATASVTRTADGVEVLIGVPEGIEDRVTQALAVRAQGVIRQLDPWVHIIDVRTVAR